MLLQLDPLGHHFDPEGQAPTLWTRTSWSTGSEGRLLTIDSWFPRRLGTTFVELPSPARYGGWPCQASQKDRFRPALQGVCEGVGKRCFVRPILTKASGKKDRFPSSDGDGKRSQTTRIGKPQSIMGKGGKRFAPASAGC
jgi:hypothetical protein